MAGQSSAALAATAAARRRTSSATSAASRRPGSRSSRRMSRTRSAFLPTSTAAGTLLHLIPAALQGRLRSRSGRLALTLTLLLPAAAGESSSPRRR